MKKILIAILLLVNVVACDGNIDIFEAAVDGNVNKVKENNLKFFPVILYGISHIVNKHREFRMDIDEQKNIGYYSYLNPCYTIFHNETITNFCDRI